MARRCLLVLFVSGALGDQPAFPPGAASQLVELPKSAALVPPEVAPPSLAEIKPENFVYVAATRSDRIGRVLAPVFINEVGPFAFVVDTGASSSVIAPGLAAKLKLVPDQSRRKWLRGITGSEFVPTVSIRSMIAGEIALTALTLPVVEPRVFADADGIFGADAFAQGCLHVNFRAKRVSILDSQCPRVGDPWEVIPATMRFGGLAVVEARIGKVRVAAVIDTGAERSLGNRALLTAAKLERAVADPASRTQVSAATSHILPGNIVTTPSLRMGGVRIEKLQVVFGDFEVFRLWNIEHEPAIVLGMDVLGTTNALMIDFKQKEVRILPAAGGVEMRTRGPATRLPPT